MSTRSGASCGSPATRDRGGCASQCRQELARFIASKGSVCIDGVSLTVNDVEGAEFGVNIIPHTHQATTLGELREGDGSTWKSI
jgi:riboflavin synthase alpha subunit